MTDFYQGQKVVVLGGAGFVGRHLCRALQKRGADVYVIDNESRHESQCDQHKIGQLTLINILSAPLLENALDHIHPFAVFNLAADVGGVEYNQKRHNEMFLGNLHLQSIPVTVCDRLKVPRFLQVSSACVYGEGATEYAVEHNLGGEPTGANAGYSWAKRMGERVAQWSSLPHAVIVRPSNIYGPGDWYDERAHVIPKLIRGYADGTAKLHNNSSVRDFIYVEDAVGGMLHALEFGDHKEVYNVGTDDMAPIFHVHDLIAELMDKPEMGRKEARNASFDQGDNVRNSDVMKLSLLGWGSKVRLKEGLKATIEAYLDKG